MKINKDKIESIVLALIISPIMLFLMWFVLVLEG